MLRALRKGGKSPFLLRANTDWMNNYYCVPSGKVEKGEVFTQAAIREAKEEVGVTIRPENLRQVLTCHRYASDGTDSWVDVVFEVTEWDGKIINAEPHIHSEVIWIDLSNLPENILPHMRAMLGAIRAGKTYYEYGWEIEETD